MWGFGVAAGGARPARGRRGGAVTARRHSAHGWHIAAMRCGSRPWCIACPGWRWPASCRCISWRSGLPSTARRGSTASCAGPTTAGQARRDGARVPAGGAHAGRHARAGDREPALAAECQKQLATAALIVAATCCRSSSWPARSERLPMLERLKTDILILGSGGAGLFAALHAHQADPGPRDHRRHQGPARQMRLHAHGAGRLQRRAQSRRLRRAPFHGHHRGRQVAAQPGARLDAGDQGHRARARAGERDRLLLRPQSRRHAARQGVRRPDLRPHRAQGRPDRHRDHQPADGAGVGAADPAAGGASRGRARFRPRTARRSPAC